MLLVTHFGKYETQVCGSKGDKMAVHQYLVYSGLQQSSDQPSKLPYCIASYTFDLCFVFIGVAFPGTALLFDPRIPPPSSQS